MTDKKRFFFDFHSDWCNPFTSNWFDFTFLKFYTNLDYVFGKVDVEIAVVGLHIELCYIYDFETPYRIHIKETLKRIQADEEKE